MNNSEKKHPLVQRADKVLASVLGHYTELPVTHGEGTYLFGMDGKRYLDFATGIAVTSTGHCHPKVSKAICDQAKKLIHACAGVVYYEPNIALAEKLAAITPFENAKTFFTNSGSEAIEGALKLARYTTKKPKLVAFQGGFHGRTFGALSLTSSKKKYSEGYEPRLPDTHIIPMDISALDALGPDKIAAVLIEPIQGEGGYIPAPKEFLQALRKYCSDNNILLIFDEVQSGMGRTGKWFAGEHYNVKPDILVLAKGIASGMPLGAFIADASLFDRWPTSAHGGTYTGNPVACAAALATIDVIKSEKLLNHVTSVGEFIQKELAKLQADCPDIKDVRGMGLLIGIEFDNAETVTKVRKQCLEKGLILISCGIHDQVIRFVPPLNVTRIQVQSALSILRDAILTLKG
ncbi:MAG: aminotransferase class III-fold pyridoxal phosphate-dependent enzyme [Candidatus Margulisiibacteriota bacterium]